MNIVRSRLMNQVSQPAAIATATVRAAGSRRATIRQSSQQHRRREGEPERRRPDHQDVADDLARPAASVSPCGFHSRIGRPSTSHDHGPGLPRVRRGQVVVEASATRACWCHSERSASGTNGNAVCGCCCGPVPALRRLAEEPAGERGQVGEHRHGAQRPRRPGQPAAQRRPGRARRTPASRQAARSQNSERTAKKARNQTPLHFTAQAQPNRKPAGDPPAAGAEPEAGAGHPVAAVPDPRAHPVAVDDQAGDRADDEHLQEDVEQADPRRGRTRSRRAASSRPATRPSSVEPVSRRASRVRTTTAIVPATADGNRQPKRVVAEQLLADRDQPLAQRRVDDERVAAVVLVTPGQQLVGLGRVVRLVEEQVVRVADAPQPADQAWRARAPRSAASDSRRSAGSGGRARRAGARGRPPARRRPGASGSRGRRAPPAREPAPPCRQGRWPAWQRPAVTGSRA